MPEKKCFVIGPFGEDDTRSRRWSNFLFETIIKPAGEDEGYMAYRTLDEPEPGNILARVLRELREADLVIADLTEENPNAFYELGARHQTGKPTIHIARSNTKLPFNVHGYACVKVDVKDNEEKNEYSVDEATVKRTKSDLSKHIKAAAAETHAAAGRAVVVYDWYTQYSATIHSEWLARQHPGIKDGIRQYEQNPEKSELTELQEKAIVEYVYLKNSATHQYNGVMFGVVNRRPAMFELGGTVYFFPQGPHYIPVKGQREQESQSWHITFEQAPREVPFRNKLMALPHYIFTVTFTPDGNGFCGDIYHPFSESLIGHATLIHKYGDRLK